MPRRTTGCTLTTHSSPFRFTGQLSSSVGCHEVQRGSRGNSERPNRFFKPGPLRGSAKEVAFTTTPFRAAIRLDSGLRWVLMHIVKDNIPKNASFILRSSVLERMIQDAGISVQVDLRQMHSAISLKLSSGHPGQVFRKSASLFGPGQFLQVRYRISAFSWSRVCFLSSSRGRVASWRCPSIPPSVAATKSFAGELPSPTPNDPLKPMRPCRAAWRRGLRTTAIDPVAPCAPKRTSIWLRPEIWWGTQCCFRVRLYPGLLVVPSRPNIRLHQGVKAGTPRLLD